MYHNSFWLHIVQPYSYAMLSFTVLEDGWGEKTGVILGVYGGDARFSII